MSLNIATAFRLRNKLKERIKELTKTCERAEVSKNKGTAENTANFDGKSFTETVSAINLLMETLKNLNLAIEKANAVNKEDLITMETVKAELAFYKSIITKIRAARKFHYEDNPEGGRDKIEQELVLDQQKIINYYDELIKKRDAIEEKLLNSNFKVKVNFDKEAITKLL